MEAALDALAPGAASGRYRVSGETVDKATGARRAISGSISVQYEDAAYTASFELRAVLPGPQASPAQAQTPAGRPIPS